MDFEEKSLNCDFNQLDAKTAQFHDNKSMTALLPKSCIRANPDNNEYLGHKRIERFYFSRILHSSWDLILEASKKHSVEKQSKCRQLINITTAYYEIPMQILFPV